MGFDTSGGVRDNSECSKSAGVTQLVECNLAKVDVAGSNPVSRSIPSFLFYYPWSLISVG